MITSLEINQYIDSCVNKYKNNFDTQEYSIKLIQIPKIANTNRNDLAVEFVNWNSIYKDEWAELIIVVSPNKPN